MSTSEVTPERWNRRDTEVIDELFQGVTSFYRPKEELRLVEYTSAGVTAIVDYCIGAGPVQTDWEAHATVVWEQSACDCKTIVGGVVKYQTEAEYLEALYKRSGIKDGRIPALPVCVGEDTAWLSARHRLYDPAAKALDLDAWCCTGSGLAVWEMKYGFVPVQGWQRGVFQRLDKIPHKLPVFLVRYEHGKVNWWGEIAGPPWILVEPLNKSAEGILPGNHFFGQKLTVPDGTDLMNEIVSKVKA